MECYLHILYYMNKIQKGLTIIIAVTIILSGIVIKKFNKLATKQNKAT